MEHGIDGTDMNSKNQYIEFAKRWYWLLAAGVIIAVVATRFALAGAVPLYRSTATAQIGRALQERTPNGNDLAIAEQLAPGYAELAKRDPILTAAAQALNVSLTPDEIRGRLLVSLVPRTQLLDITVIDSDPQRAAALANEIARQLILQSPDASQEESSRAFVESQLIDLQSKIVTGEQRVDELEVEITKMTSAADIADAQLRRNAIQAQIDGWQQTYANLLNAVGPSRSNSVEIVSEALPASTPIPRPTTMYYALAIVIGISLSTLMALGLSMLSSVIKSIEDLQTVSQHAPVISIPKYRAATGLTPMMLHAPNTPATAAYRVLRNTLRVGGMEGNRVTIAVTSSRTGEGKTTTASNLAVAMANSGFKVILVDANFRNPQLHHIFGVFADFGLTDLMLGKQFLQRVLIKSRHPNLMVLPNGVPSAIYADMLSSTRINRIMDLLTEDADVVIFDTAAVQEEQESLLLAKAVSIVLVVAEARRVRVSELEQTLDLLRRADARVAAVALNKVVVRGMLLKRLYRFRSSGRPDARQQIMLEHLIAERMDDSPAPTIAD
jgi:capsular exopolysaccharide synthesis family protein